MSSSRIPHPASRIIFLAIILAPHAALAHEVRPAYLELREAAPGEFSVLWKTPMRGELRLGLEPKFSGNTERLTPVETRETGNAAVQTWRIKAVDPLRGQSVRIAGLDATMTDALVRIEFADGTSWTQRLSPGAPSAPIPSRQSGWAVAGVYFNLGVEHILLGVDHLLFVLALLIIVRGVREEGRGENRGTRVGGRVKKSSLITRHSSLLMTITAFTVAHSITLSAATLGFVHVPPPPVEAVIALSIVFVAAEIVWEKRRYEIRDTGYGIQNTELGVLDQGLGSRIPDLASRISNPGSRISKPASLTIRAPWIVAFTFGLLHGLGFAGALSEIGLPQGRIPVALLFFNLGVEAGQLMFIVVVLALIWLGRDVLYMIRDAGSGIRDAGYEIQNSGYVMRDTGHEISRIPHRESRIAFFPIPHPASRITNLTSRIELITAYAIGGVAMFWVIQRIAAF